MKRKIIQIDPALCNGCGKCIPDCKEGALQLIDGKARLISDLFCDGLGACIGSCPRNAIKVEEREALAYDERLVMLENIIPQGVNTIKAHLKHLIEHGESKLYNIAVEVLKEENIPVPPDIKPESMARPLGCPGQQSAIWARSDKNSTDCSVASELRQWPIQLHLINPDSAIFDDANLLICADCVPFAYGDFQSKLLKDRIVINFCPKLDGSHELYVEKLTRLFQLHKISSITIARMEVPCCGGTVAIVQEALAQCGSDLIPEIKIIKINGDLA